MRCRVTALLLLVLSGVSVSLLPAAAETAPHVLRPPAELYVHRGGPSGATLALDLAQARVDGASRATSRFENGVLTVPDCPSMVMVPVDANASEYSMMRVRMRHDRGPICGFKFLGQGQPDIEAMPWNHIMITADGTMRTYEVPLQVGVTHGWAGRIQALVMVPCPEPASVVIESVEFVQVRPTGPNRVTLDGDTHLALVDSSSAWTLDVPEGGRLEAYAGVMGAPDINASLVFRVHFERDDGVRTTVIDESLGIPANGRGAWKRLEADLGPLAGASGALKFEVGTSQQGATGYWGSPLVHRPGVEEGGIPVILISNDTLRADHLSCYGYERDTTPSMDAFARDAVLFENAVSEMPSTLYAHMTMLTGLHPRTHGVTPNQNLAEEVETLPEVLAAAGYVTAGYTGHGPLLYAARGFAQGFDIYSTPDTFRTIIETREHLSPWLDAHADGTFFLFFHHYDIHSKFPDVTRLPYYPVKEEYLKYSLAFDPPPPLTRPGKDLPASAFLMAINAGQITPPDEHERDYIIALYDDGIRAADAVLGEFLQDLRDKGIYDRALVIITADHGESFGEHELYAHGEVYETCVHVPLLVKFPRSIHAGKRVSTMVALADLMPTVLDAVGVPCPPGKDGVSLVRTVEGDGAVHGQIGLSLNQWEAVRSNEWKLVLNRSTSSLELFNLVEDPRESKNVYMERPPALEPLEESLAQFHMRPRGGWHILVRRGPGGDGPVGVAVNAMSPAGIAAASIRMGDPFDTLMQGEGGPGMAAMLSLAPGDEDEVLVEPGAGDGSLHVTIQSERELIVSYAGTTKSGTSAWNGQLHPDTGSGAVPERTEPPRDDTLTVSIWFDGQLPKQADGVTLSDEQREHLRALGYVD